MTTDLPFDCFVSIDAFSRRRQGFSDAVFLFVSAVRQGTRSACLLGWSDAVRCNAAAKLLKAREAELPGTVVLLFQPEPRRVPAAPPS